MLTGLILTSVVSLQEVCKSTVTLDEIKVVSIHSRKSNGDSINMAQTQGIISTSEILYIEPNKKRTDNRLSVNRLQLPLAVTSYGSIDKITYPIGKVIDR